MVRRQRVVLAVVAAVVTVNGSTYAPSPAPKKHAQVAVINMESVVVIQMYARAARLRHYRTHAAPWASKSRACTEAAHNHRSYAHANPLLVCVVPGMRQ